MSNLDEHPDPLQAPPATIESWGELWHKSAEVTAGPGTWWSDGQMSVEHHRLRQLLARSARRQARIAIRQYSAETWEQRFDAAVGVGAALEQLAKAVVASVEPTLLAEKGDRDTILALSGKGHLQGVPAARLLTIGAGAALAYVTKLHPQWSYVPDRDQLPLKVRNSAVHLAVVEADDLRKACQDMARLVEGLLVILELDSDHFWGPDLKPAVQALLDKAETELRQAVTAKVAAAKAHFAQLLSGLPPAEAALVLSALSSRPRQTTDHHEAQDCPACQHVGWLACLVDADYDDEFEMFDTDGVSAGHFVPQYAYPRIFECGVCGLYLKGLELTEFDFPDRIELDPLDFDPPDWEPDEDWLRGR